MVLAAGLGRRMAPLSDACAKPALPVLDRPILAWLLDLLAEQGVDLAVVNAHAHVPSLRAALRDARLRVELSLEPELLGSAGGIRAARAWLGGDEPFLVINGDMLLELDLAALVARHRSAGTLATLLLRDDPRKRVFGSIGYDPSGRVCRITERFARGREDSSGLFTGVQVLEPAIFERMGVQTPLELIPHLYVPLLESGGEIAAALQPPEQAWWPIGSPAELLDANLRALERAEKHGSLDGGVRLGALARVDGELRPPVWIGERASVARGAIVGPHAVIGARAALAAGARVCEALALPDARVAAGEIRRAVAFGAELWRDA
jgi:NDP-sugar pyrophosphorylase family protein